MHYIDSISGNRLKGWIAGDSDGRPSQFVVEFGTVEVPILTSKPRQDVLTAGYTLFSGFDLSVSSNLPNEECLVTIENEAYSLSMTHIPSSDILKIDTKTSNSISGWIACADSLRFLAFGTPFGIVKANTAIRGDINQQLRRAPETVLGFEVCGVNIDVLLWININHAHLHWLANKR